MASYLQLGAMHIFELPGSPNNRSIHFVCTDCSRWLLQFFPTICFWLFWVSKSILGLGPVISCLYISRSCDRLMHLPQFDAVVWYSYDFFLFVKFCWLFCNFLFPPLASEHRMVNACQCYGMLWACARPLEPEMPGISSRFIDKPQPVPLYPHVFRPFRTHT